MNGWQRWWLAPHTHWLRRTLFQVHLWLGIGFGLYILIISVSGSAVVLRPQINRWFVHSQVESSVSPVLPDAELQQRAARVYAPADVMELMPQRRPNGALLVRLQHDGREETRFFDQYRGEDLGSTSPWQVDTVEWLTRLHDELLLERRGRMLNGIGAALFLLMLGTGLCLWWQGRRRWHEGLRVRFGTARPLLWQLHGFAGFWGSLLCFAWGLTAVYFAWPEPFEWLIDALDDDLTDLQRPDGWLLFLIDLHFGRFRGTLWAACLWVVLGLLPAFLYISGFVLWYRRLQGKRRYAGPSGQHRQPMP